ncbi:hypothetical protein NW127_05895 [Staphylococcus pettenkoferi]|nr:hypothetical protein [Staphylococcus pettenkoferi]MCY1576204.1 hypothetical protein [Staphylococcus pettenkoferi]MCY1619080.1 hypothetical protein [Staphylococcus pettenkoferi]
MAMRRFILMILFGFPFNFLYVAYMCIPSVLESDFLFDISYILLFIVGLIPVLIAILYKWERDFWLFTGLQCANIFISCALSRLFIDLKASADIFVIQDASGAVIMCFMAQSLILAFFVGWISAGREIIKIIKSKKQKNT